MTNELKQLMSIQESDKKATKRKLARNLIQQIIQLYSTIIQKVEHGIGLLWEEYISQQLYSIAKKKVQNDLINDLQQLQCWFQNIAENIKEKFNTLSENLMCHFNSIIKLELQSLNPQENSPLKFTQNQLLQTNQQKDFQSNDENKESLSLYETCTESSKQEQYGIMHPKKLCIACQEHLSEAFGYCSKHQFMQLHQQKVLSNEQNLEERNKFQQQIQFRQRDLNQKFHISSERCCYNQSPKKRRRKIENYQSQQKQDQQEGGFYEVFFGLLEAFQM